VRIGVDSALRVEFSIANRSLKARHFLVAATGRDASYAKGDPSDTVIEPMGHGVLAAVVRVPAKVESARIDLTLWVRGCRDYIVPVCALVEGERGGALERRSIVEQVDDCHTWRDHFYVSRPCVPIAERRQEVPGRGRK
jgi:hypothetical protein